MVPPPAPQPDASAAQAAPADRDAPGPAPEGRWAINVLSTQDLDKADRLIKALADTPYQVYAYETVVKGALWHRIRVGFFRSRAEAQAVGDKLAAEHHLPEPWIVRPTQEERDKYLAD